MISTKPPGLLDRLCSGFWVLIIGSVISIIFTGLLIPRLTQTWQGHQKELEVKTALVTQIRKSVSDFLISARLVEVHSPSIAPADFHNANRNWSEVSADIESELMAYFPTDAYSAEWHNYTVILEKFYFLSAVNIPGPIRKAPINSIQEYLYTGGISHDLATSTLDQKNTLE
jgi:hypothetical protein